MVVGRFLPPAEHHHRMAFLVELDHHVGAFVHDPEIVVSVDTDAVRVAEPVEVLPPLAQIASVLVELEDLGGDGAKERPADVRARRHEHVTSGIDGHRSHLAQVHLEGVLEEVRHRFEGDFRRHGRRLGERPVGAEDGKDRDQRDEKTLHGEASCDRKFIMGATTDQPEKAPSRPCRFV